MREKKERLRRNQWLMSEDVIGKSSNSSGIRGTKSLRLADQMTILNQKHVPKASQRGPRFVPPQTTAAPSDAPS